MYLAASSVLRVRHMYRCRAYLHSDVRKDIAMDISVFARHAPRQKEAIIAAFNAGGKTSLMCGDGTNDVGALRRAHVGISLISAPEVESKQRKAAAALSLTYTVWLRDACCVRVLLERLYAPFLSPDVYVAFRVCSSVR